MKRLAILMIAATFAVTAVAQEVQAGGGQGQEQGQGQGRQGRRGQGGEGQGQRQGRGQRQNGEGRGQRGQGNENGGGGFRMGGGGMQGMRFAGGGGRSMTLMREDVQKDLNLSTEQKTKLKDLQEKSMAAFRDMMTSAMASGQGANAAGSSTATAGNGGNGERRFNMSPEQRDEMRKKGEELQKQNEAEIAKILTPEQSKRLDEISFQLGGTRSVVWNKELQTKLGVTAEQKAKFDKLQQGLQNATRALGERLRNQEIDIQQFQEIQDKNNKAMDAEIDKILSQAQKAKMKEMSGKPFQADPNSNTFRFGGPGGGRGGNGGGGGGGAQIVIGGGGGGGR